MNKDKYYYNVLKLENSCLLAHLQPETSDCLFDQI
jgi:hypothetical protein